MSRSVSRVMRTKARRMFTAGLLAVLISGVLGVVGAPFWSLYIVLPPFVLVFAPWIELGEFPWQLRRRR